MSPPFLSYGVHTSLLEKQVVIEIDGDSHFTDEGQDYDIERTRILEFHSLNTFQTFSIKKTASNRLAVRLSVIKVS
ncbi:MULTISPECIES: DUF559 domain-containing protein [unclassified Nostoc]|uniref:DUF559 domain-containing protein n=1 Tax=unclassified Nostoc TaxID=2593658 RepID=UPI000DEC9826|nr:MULTISPECIES: DUF559 domain-containing protein [unclassified Nostoc]QHG15251.1 DUF559 domain-containing protein [Nostoc sp. ATCC 53789]QLE47434.1 DUF559 domain-containing protein [Nostoc sp. C057]